MISGPASGVCNTCGGDFLQLAPDATQQFCQPDTIEVLLIVAAAFASTCFSFLCLSGFLGQVAVADVSAQGEKLVMTTTQSHYLLKHSAPEVILTGIGVPHLEGLSWKVRALNSFQLTLHRCEANQLDTSMGSMVIRSPRAFGSFIHRGFWRCPLILWCLLFGAAAASSLQQRPWQLLWPFPTWA